MDYIYGLIEEGKYTEAMELCKDALANNPEDYYEVLATYVRLLNLCELFEDAIDILNNELLMPYVPLEYEEVFKQELIFAQNCKRIKDGVEGVLVLTDEEITEALLYEDDEIRVMSVLEQIGESNVRKFLDVIQEYLLIEDKNPVYKTMLLEILAQQDVNQTFKVLKQDNFYEINPSTFDLVLDHNKVKMVHHVLEDKLFNNPSLQLIAIDLFNTFAYVIYPDLYDLDVNLCAASVHALAIYYQGQFLDLGLIENLYNVKNEDIEKYTFYIQSLITDGN